VGIVSAEELDRFGLVVLRGQRRAALAIPGTAAMCAASTSYGSADGKVPEKLSYVKG